MEGLHSHLTSRLDYRQNDDTNSMCHNGNGLRMWAMCCISAE